MSTNSLLPWSDDRPYVPVVEFDRITAMASRALKAPIALLSEVNDREQRLWSRIGLAAPWPAKAIPLSHSICRRVAEKQEPVAVDNALKDTDLDHHPAVQEYGVGAYLGVPVQRPGAEAPAVLSVIDTSPRVWTDEDCRLLVDFGTLIERELVSRDRGTDGRFGYRTLFEASTVALMVIDPDSSTILDANPAACDLYCMAHEDIIGAQLDTIIRFARGDESVLERVRAGEDSFHMATVRECSNGQQVELEMRLLSVEGEGRRVTLLTALDQTGRNRAKSVLRASEARFRQIAEAMPQMVWTTDARGQTVFLNQRWHTYTGIHPDNAEGTWDQVVHPDDLEPSVERWNDSLTTGAPFEVEYRIKRAKDGAYRWFIGRAEPVRDSQGRIVQWFGTFTDIHDLREARQQLQASTERLRLVHRATTDVVWDWDAESGMTEWSPAIRDVLGWNVLKTRLAWGQTRIHPDDRDRVVESFSAAIERGGPTWQDEYRFPRADGSYVFVLDRGHIKRNADGVATRIVGALVDLSERKAIESQLIAARQAAEESQQSLREHWHELAKVQEEERRSLALELHDGIGQVLTSLVLSLDAAAQLPDRAGPILTEARGIAQQLQSDVRKLSFDLRPPMLNDLGLLPTLAWLAEWVEDHLGVAVVLSTPKVFPPLSYTVSTTAYRIVQEALTNVAKHADTDEATVEVGVASGWLSLTVSDAGRGFETHPDARKHRGMGLAGMAERANHLGGSVDVESVPGDGTRLCVRLPIDR